MHRSRLRAPDVRPMHAWEFSDEPGRRRRSGRTRRSPRSGRGAPRDVVAVDRLGTPAFLALQDAACGSWTRRRSPRRRAASRPRGGRALRAERRAPAGHARGVRGRGRARHLRTRAARRDERRDGPRRRRVPRHHDRLLGSQHESLAGRGHRPSPRARGPRVRRHRHGRHRGLLLLRVAHVPRRERAVAGPAGPLPLGARLARGDGGPDPPGGDLRRAGGRGAPRSPSAILAAAVRVHVPRHRPRGGEPEPVSSRRPRSRTRPRCSRRTRCSWWSSTRARSGRATA